MDTKVLGRVWASTPETPNIDPGVSKYQLGWVAEIPVYQMLNFMDNRHDTNTLSLAERGVFQWGSDINYKQNAIAWDETDGYIYVSKVASPSTSTRPGLNTSQWEKSAIQITRKQYDDEVAAWNAHIANVANPHQLTCAILNTYTRPEIDAMFASTDSEINSHITDTSNPHHTTAAQVGAVPITGGTYEGEVTHKAVKTGFGPRYDTQYITSDDVGMFLHLNNVKLGINANSEGVFVNESGTESRILSEHEYVMVRTQQDPLYVPPVYDLAIDLKNRVTMRVGMGETTFTAPAGRGYTDKSGKASTAGLNEPRFTNKGLFIDQAATEVLSIPTNNNLKNFAAYSISMDVEPGTSASNAWIARWLCGSIECGFYKTNTDQLRYYYSEGGVQKYLTLQADSTKWVGIGCRLTVAVSNTGVRAFYNGILVASTGTATNLVTGDDIKLSYSGSAWFSVIKIWAKALTNEQASNA